MACSRKKRIFEKGSSTEGGVTMSRSVGKNDDDDDDDNSCIEMDTETARLLETSDGIPDFELSEPITYEPMPIGTNNHRVPFCEYSKVPTFAPPIAQDDVIQDQWTLFILLAYLITNMMIFAISFTLVLFDDTHKYIHPLSPLVITSWIGLLFVCVLVIISSETMTTLRAFLLLSAIISCFGVLGATGTLLTEFNFAIAFIGIHVVVSVLIYLVAWWKKFPRHFFVNNSKVDRVSVFILYVFILGVVTYNTTDRYIYTFLLGLFAGVPVLYIKKNLMFAYDTISIKQWMYALVMIHIRSYIYILSCCKRFRN